MTLRPYQKEALKSVASSFQEGITKQLISLPTGAGKTIIIAAMAKHFNKKTLIIAHRKELIQQAYDKLKLFWSKIDIGICNAQYKKYKNKVVIGSVQSCSQKKLLEQLQKQDFDILIIDEAHHAPAESYTKIIDALGFNDNKKLLIGVTATPDRSDNKELGNNFQKIVYTKTIGDLIKEGYLSPVTGRKIHTNISLKGVRTYKGDFNAQELSHVVNVPERNDFIVKKFMEHGIGRKAIAFCVDVQHCKDLEQTFLKHGIKAASVWGAMPSQDRTHILKQFKEGDIEVVTSCSLLTEGYDEPSIAAICMARPTKSKALYIQMVGRGLRICPGKQNLLVLDFTDENNNLSLIVSLKTTIPEAAVVVESNHKQKSPKTRQIKTDSEMDQEFDIVGQDQFLWVFLDDNEYSLQDDNRNEIVMRQSSYGFVADFYIYKNDTPNIIVTNPLSFEYCKEICEEFARKNLNIKYAVKSSEWLSRHDIPSRKQIEWLYVNDRYYPGISKQKAEYVMREAIAQNNKKRRDSRYLPVTPAQSYVLQKHNINPVGMSKLQAMNEIEKIKQMSR